MASKDRLREAAEKRIKELSRLRQRSLRQRIADYGPQEQYTEELEHEMKRHGSLSGRKSRGLRGLGDSAMGHADKAFNLANSAIRAFKQATQPGKSCKAAFALYTNGAITMGEANGHHAEARGMVSKAGNRRIELEDASEKAYAAVRGCLREDASLSGMRKRRTSRRSKR